MTTESIPSEPNLGSSGETTAATRALFSIDKIDEWRQRQHEILGRLRNGAGPDITDNGYIDEFNAGTDDLLREFLEQNGIETTDDVYQAIFDLYSQASINKIHEDEWLASPASRGKDVTDKDSPRDKVARHIEQMEIARTTSDVEGEKKEQDTTLEKLNKAREAKHEAYVARLKGSLFGDKRRKNDQVYREAETAYREALGKRLEERVGELREEGKTDEEIKDFIKQQANEFVKGDMDTQRALLVTESGGLGRFLEKYANASRGKKIAYALGLGAGAAIAGMGAGLIAGAALGAAGGLALTGLAATGSSLAWKGVGAFRAYHLRRADIFKNKDVAGFELNDSATVEGERLRMLDFLQNTSSEQLEEGERIKKRAMLFAVGSVAVGSTVGMGVHAAIDNGDWAHWWGGLMQHTPEYPSGIGPTPPDTEVEAHPNEGTLPSERYPDTDSSGESPAPPEPEPELASSRDEIIKDYIAEHAAARKIRPGEGWYQTFKELGIKRDNWDELLKDIGPKLQDMEYKGTKLAYWDEQANEWRMNITENGKMPKSALRIIIEQAEEKGYLEKPLGFDNLTSATEVAEATAPVDSVSESASVDTSTADDKLINDPSASPEFAAASTVSKGESITTMLDQLNRAGVINVESGQYDTLMKVAGPELAKLHYPDGTPVAYPFRRFPYDWRLYMSPDGRLHPDAIRVLERLSRQGNYDLVA